MDYDLYNGPSMATLLLAALLVLLIVGLGVAWISQQQPAPAPPPPAPPPPAPPAPLPKPPTPKAPSPPLGVSGAAERWLATMKAQIKAVSSSPRPFQTDRTLSDEALNAIVDPAAAHIVSLIADYEARVDQFATHCKRLIEK
jgi:hypothetical protein